ncbi:MAG: hypothetical protein C0600_09440 [Ignavibacteria bacterium]|nr:MAG: hypothetical protein C0600_09440 [Ignavibacteria bacterium]
MIMAQGSGKQDHGAGHREAGFCFLTLIVKMINIGSMVNEMEYNFTAPVLQTETGLVKHYFPIPDDIGEELWNTGVRRVIATLNGREYRRALSGTGDGGRCLIVGEPLLKEIGARLNDMVDVTLRADPEPDSVDICEEFAAVLEQDEDAAQRFYSMTSGMQRSLILYVTTAKREETRIKRSLELAYKLRTYTLSGDRPE